MHDHLLTRFSWVNTRRRPLNWDDLGSSAKDNWEARQLRAMRQGEV